MLMPGFPALGLCLVQTYVGDIAAVAAEHPASGAGQPNLGISHGRPPSSHRNITAATAAKASAPDAPNMASRCTVTPLRTALTEASS